MDRLLFSDRMVRDCLTEPKSITTISEELKMEEHHVIQSLLKLYKNGKINWYNKDAPEFYLIKEQTKDEERLILGQPIDGWTVGLDWASYTRYYDSSTQKKIEENSS